MKFTGEMWARTRIYETKFEFPGATLADLFQELFAQFNLRDLVLDDNDQFVFRSGVLVNGRSAKYLGGLAAPIQDGDEVIVMRPSIGAM
ncbi:MAG: MoaD/ThiS family protein [Chloroflexi bacterium]|nr:MoaD/ThiS family protein [Chloroflexota bacterium]